MWWLWGGGCETAAFFAILLFEMTAFVIVVQLIMTAIGIYVIRKGNGLVGGERAVCNTESLYRFRWDSGGISIGSPCSSFCSKTFISTGAIHRFTQ